MIQRVCDVEKCGKESPFTRQAVDIPVASAAVHDRESVDVPRIVMKKHDLCEDHYQFMMASNLFSGKLDIDGNYEGIVIPEAMRRGR